MYPRWRSQPRPALLIVTCALVLGCSTTVRAQWGVGTLAAALAALKTQPNTMSRDDQGHLTIRATRVIESLRVDGRLDERDYTVVPAVTGFVQQLPDEGAAATERTEVWILYDDVNLYVSARCWDSAPPAQWVANEMRRDSDQIEQNDTFGLLLDTFHDRRNGLLFFTNPLGALADQQITDERSSDSDWNPIWEVKTQQFSGGWTVEMKIPFKSIRYGPGREPAWGIQLRRVVHADSTSGRLSRQCRSPPRVETGLKASSAFPRPRPWSASGCHPRARTSK